MEYLTLLDYLYVISAPERIRIADKLKGVASHSSLNTIKERAFFLPNHLTLLNRLFTLKHHTSIH